MKKLIGIKKDISFFENKEMKNLQSVVGGLEQISIESNCPSCEGGVEFDKYTSDGTYIGRVEVGCP